jgi:hypothetical protein
VYVAPSPGYGKVTGFSQPWYVGETGGGFVGLDKESPYFTTRDGQFLLFGDYRYDADQPVSASNPVCVMCNPDGSGPIPSASFTRSTNPFDPAGRANRGISENGEYVFFDTKESLVPQATNGAIDVYEWEADGAGSCIEAQGCISLISSGQDSHNSYFLGSSAYVNAKGETVEGGNVFFGTHAQLVPQDTDEEGDLYDARIDGGFVTTTGAGPCEGDACENPPPAPIDQTPASLTFSGAGDVTGEPPPPPTVEKKTVKCAKGKRLSGGRCVKKRTGKKMGRKAKRTKRAKGSSKSSRGGRS